MKVVHLADTHLGFRQLHRVDATGRNVRERDVYDAFERAIAKAVELKPAALIHAGDLFDSANPWAAALRVALDGFVQLKAAGIPTVVIAGNHSTPRAAASEHVFAVLERFGGIHLVYREPAVVRLGGLAVHAIPHHNDPDQVTAWMQQARPCSDADYNILVAHVGLGGFGNLVGPETSAAKVSGEELLSTKGFDYVALGHLHKVARVSDNAAYAGSLERLSWADDEANPKGVLEADLSAAPGSEHQIRMHTIPVRRQIRLDPVDAATTADLTAAILARATEAEADSLRGAMVRLSVRNVTAAAWSAVDYRAVTEAFAECLHFEREPEFLGRSAEPVDSVPELHEFLLRWPGAQGAGFDTPDFIARADAFLSQADEDIASRESKAA